MVFTSKKLQIKLIENDQYFDLCYTNIQMSEISGSSSKSDLSNLFSLSQNKSQHIIQDNQIDQFRQKLGNLFNIDPTNLDDLFLKIQQRTTKNFIDQKIYQFDQMLGSLKDVKRNNREMAKLVGMLGVKLDRNSKQRQIKYQYDNIHKIDKSIDHSEINPTQASQQYYNYRPKPIYSMLINISEQTRIKNQKVFIQKQKSYYEVYQQKNRLYQDKISNIFNELVSIKNQLNRKTSIELKYQAEDDKPTKYKKPQQQLFLNLNSKQKKQVLSQVQSQVNSRNKQIFQRRQKNNQPFVQVVDNDNDLYQKNLKYNKPQSQIRQSNNYLYQTNLKNQKVLEDVRNISIKLQQIKIQAKKYQSQKLSNKRRILNQVVTQQYNQRQNIQIIKQIQKTTNQYDHQNSLMVNNQPNQVKKKKKSILEGMKNVQSKVLISENNIPQKDQQAIISNLTTNINQQVETSARSNNLVDCKSARSNLNQYMTHNQSKKVILSYLTMQQPSQNTKAIQKNQELLNTNQRTKTHQTKVQSAYQFQQNPSQRFSKRSIHKSPSHNPSHFQNTSIMQIRRPIPSNHTIILSNRIIQGKAQLQQSSNKNQSFYKKINNINYSDSRIPTNIQPNHQIQENFSFLQINQNFKPNYQKVGSNHQNLNPNHQNIKPNHQNFIPNHQILRANYAHFNPNISTPQNKNIQTVHSFELVNSPIKVVRPMQRARIGIPVSVSSSLSQSRNLIPNTSFTFKQINQQMPPKMISPSNSSMNISMNDLENRFRVPQNLLSPGVRDNRLAFQVASSRSNSIQAQKEFTLQNNSYIRPSKPFQQTIIRSIGQNSQPHITKPILQRPFNQIKSQINQQLSYQPTFKQQYDPSCLTNCGYVNHGGNSKVEPFLMLGNSSKLSTKSKESKDSNKRSKSKGLQLMSTNM